MQVSFTGIKNLYIGKKQYSKNGIYLDPTLNFSKGEKKYTDILIKCNLTNDKDGNDLDTFHSVLKNSTPEYYNNCINPKNPDEIKIKINHFDVDDDIANVSVSMFKINDYDVVLSERIILPLYTFLAKLTKKISSLPETSDAQKHYVKLANKYIAEEAGNFIDNM